MHHHPARAGFSLVEVVIATAVLAVGLLGLIAASIATQRMIRRGAAFTRIAAVAMAKFEQIGLRPCSGETGDSVAGPLRLRWAAGPGVGTGVVTVVVESTDPSLMRVDTLSGRLPCR